MKIIFVTSTLSSGGTERVISLLANAMSEKGHDVEIVCFNQHLVFYPIDKRVNVLFAEDCGSRFIGKKMLWFRNHVKKWNPDVVVPFMTDVYCVTILALKGMKVPIVSSERIDPRYSDWFRRTERWIFLRGTTHHVVQTEDIKSYYSKQIQHKTSVIYNPVTDMVFYLKPVEKKHQIISVGRLDPQKNQPLLINAFKAISEDFPEYRLYIYGEGPSRAELELLIKQLDLEDRVLLPGRTEHIIDELNNSMLFCLSSDAEGMSNAMIEAMCVGLPILTTNVCGAMELIEHGKSGYVTPVKDLPAFVMALRTLLSDEKKMEEMGKLNKEKAVLFRKEHIVQQWEELFYRVKTN